MNLLLNVLFPMTLTGSVSFLVYLVIQRFAGTRISTGLQYLLLRLCLVFWLFPVSLVKSLFLHYASSVTSPGQIAETYIYTDNAIVLSNTGYQIQVSGISRAILFAWGMLILLLACRKTVCFLRFRLHAKQWLLPDQQHEALLNEWKEKYGIRRRITLYGCGMTTSPFTLGTIWPCIVLTTAVSEEGVSAALRHELIHIRSHDFFWRLVTSLAVLIHCFNPLIYFFRRELAEIQEFRCDEELTREFSHDETLRYGHMLVDIATVPIQTPFYVPYFTGNRKKALKRRLLRLSHPVPKQNCILAAAFVLLFAACASSTAAAFSVDVADIRWLQTYTSDQAGIGDWYYLLAENDFVLDNQLYFEHPGTYLLLEEGSIYLYSDDQFPGASQYLSCTHNCTHGVIKEHTKNADGGCTVTTYAAKYCPECNTITTYVSTANYTDCAH